MCGINGFTFPDKAKISRMNQLLKHRGPDDVGIYLDEDISLGNTRLAILDLSQKGHQPMFDTSGRYTIVFNGEIYNFKELRESLIKKKFKFVSDTDTEVILNLYREYGEKAISMLNGMFALAIWDRKEKKLVLARDRFGIKPLYYAVVNNIIFFSSEIKALFVHPFKKEIDKQSFGLYLRLLYVPAPFTIFKGIFKAIPGQMLIWQKQRLVKKNFWKPSSLTLHLNKKQTKAAIYRSLYDSVKRQLVADRPVGIFLSGGIDSTVLLGLSTQINSSPMKTFSVGFKGVEQLEKYNADFILARKSAKYYHADHHECLISPSEALEKFQELIRSMDEPISNPTHIPTYFLAQQARKEVVVALGGDGGDELFGGYEKYLDAWLLDLYLKIPQTLRGKILDKLLEKLKNNQNIDVPSIIKAEKNAEKYLIFMGTPAKELSKIYSQKQNNIVKGLSPLRGFSSKNRPFHQLLPLLDLYHWLPEESLMRSDKMTMLFGLEQRVPFLDNGLLDLAMRIPFTWKVGLKLRKKILRETFATLLPGFIGNEPKRGFFSPGAKWLRHPKWKQYANLYLDEKRLEKDNLFYGKNLIAMYNDHLEGRRYNVQLLWAVLTFLSWKDHTGAYL